MMRMIHCRQVEATVSFDSVFKARELPPYDEKIESSILLNTFARVSMDKDGDFKFDGSD